MRDHLAFIAVLLTGTMLAGGAAAEELTAYPGDTIEVEYGWSGGGAGGNEQDDEDTRDFNQTVGEAIQDSASEGSGCDSMMAQAASGAATGIGVILSVAGVANAPLQVAQQLQLLAQTICDTEQTRLQGEQLGELRRATARINGNAATGIRRIERGARQAIGAMDRSLYGRNADVVMHDRYQSGMPDGWTFDDAAKHARTMRRQTDLATREAAATAAMSNRAVNDALAVSDDALALSQGAEGQTSAIQAQTQMISAQIAIDSAKQASDTAMATANLRVAEEQRAQEIIASQKLERFYGPGTIDMSAAPRRAVFN